MLRYWIGVGVMKVSRLLLLLAAAVPLAMPVAASAADKGAGTLGRAAPLRLPDEGSFPSLAGATAWLNSAPLSATALRGKVVLVDVWTYTCINWLRTEPYIRAWADKYKAQGLVVVGVHSPEFEFEKNLDNVRDATTTMRIDYPVAVDSDHAIWRAFDNQYWPALYLIDASGPSATIISARAGTRRRSERSSSCWPKRAGRTSIVRWYPWTPRVPKSPPIGIT